MVDLKQSVMKYLNISFIIILGGFLLTSSFIPQLYAQDSTISTSNVVDTMVNDTNNSVTADNSNVNGTEEFMKDDGLATIPLIINMTQNTNATDTAINYVLEQLNSTSVDSSIIEENAIGQIKGLINTLENTNATSVAAEIIINITQGNNQ
ncbi:MAG: hypothetical protein ACPKPY_00075 [Nitrososphaeraceae archaeon]